MPWLNARIDAVLDRAGRARPAVVAFVIGLGGNLLITSMNAGNPMPGIRIPAAALLIVGLLLLARLYLGYRRGRWPWY
jgi:hypothetical protein